MVDFALSEEERMIRDLAHEFAEKEIRPVAEYYDEHEGEYPMPVVKKAAQLGLAGGAFGAGGISGVLIVEELSWGCAGIALAIFSSGLAAAAIYGMGTEEQKAKFLPMCMSTENEVKIGAYGLTEPEAGSDVANISTTAVRDGDFYVLNGTKRFITNGGIADVTVVFATEDKSKGWGGLCAFAIEKGTPGLIEGTVWKKMGIRASHTSDVILDNCRVPLDHRLGDPPGQAAKEGVPPRGAFGALGALERTRPVIGAFSLGVGRAALEYAIDYAKERIQFGKPIATRQAIAFKLADMAIEMDAARLIVWRAAWMAANNVPFLRAEGSMSKCFPSDVAMRVTLEALQVLGGYGYMREFPVEKWVRDAKIFQIFEGTNEIQRIVISRALTATRFL
jgi:acyl-CoA dehydrogenase